jgi:hypothetical protein
MNKKEATSYKQQATGRHATRNKTKHADNADSKGFSQIRKKICGHLFKSASSACLLQAERSWGYKITTTLS